ncbi:hypothetical protein BDZ97DRAFT_1681766, partial [Flammula alnicola]
NTGGKYPELITRPDIKVFLPPYWWLDHVHLYVIPSFLVHFYSEDIVVPVGDPVFMSDQSKELTLRVHDECNGSDVFGLDICT